MVKKMENFPVYAGMVIPAAGHLLLGRPMRGFIMLLWMFVMGFITYKLTNENISFIGRFSGGFAIYVLSVLDVHRFIARRRARQ